MVIAFHSLQLFWGQGNTYALCDPCVRNSITELDKGKLGGRKTFGQVVILKIFLGHQLFVKVPILTTTLCFMDSIFVRPQRPIRCIAQFCSGKPCNTCHVKAPAVLELSGAPSDGSCPSRRTFNWNYATNHSFMYVCWSYTVLIIPLGIRMNTAVP